MAPIDPMYYANGLGLSGRGKCPRCKRNLSFGQGVMRHHVAEPSQSGRIRTYKRRADEVVRAEDGLARAQFEGSSWTIALRWWFRDMGGAQAFDEFKGQQ